MRHLKSTQQVYMRVALLCWLFLASCSPSSVGPISQHSHTPTVSASQPIAASSGPIDHPVTTTGCGRTPPVVPGSSADQTIAENPAEALGNSTRNYRVHVPAGYQSNAPIPLVLYFHGHGGNALDGDRNSGFSAFADQQHFIIAYGQGLQEGQGGPTFWADSGPIDYGVDDLHYVSLMLDDLQSKLCIDARRIFETGFSNGGGMSNDLACNLAGRIAAFAPVSGDYYIIGGCHPSRPVSIMDIDGSADQLVPYEGNSVNVSPAWPEPSIPQQLQDWANRDVCQQGPVVFLSTAQVTGERWTNCQGGAEVVSYLIIGGGHAWPGTLSDRSSLAVMWDFFQAHPLPQST